MVNIFEEPNGDYQITSRHDAALHRFTHWTTGRAGSIIETALAKAIEWDSLAALAEEK